MSARLNTPLAPLPGEQARYRVKNSISGPAGLFRSPAPSPLSTSQAPLSRLLYSAASRLGALIPRGTGSASPVGFVFLCILWYFSSAFASNTGKVILTAFKFPVTLTFVQFAFVAFYSALILALRAQNVLVLFEPRASHPKFHPAHSNLRELAGWGIKVPTRIVLQGTLLMSLFQISGHVFSSMAIARVPVSTVHTIKALAPLFTVVAYAALFRVQYSSATYVSLLPLTLGVMLACSFDLRANAAGLLCALGSTVIFVSQNIFSKKLLPSDSEAAGSTKLDKLNLLLYSSGIAFVLMIPIWLYSDAAAVALWTPPAGDPTPALRLAWYFFLNGTIHFSQNLIAFTLLARTSPVTYSIASLIKRIAVICIAIVWAHQAVSAVQAVGMALTFAGLWLYNRAKSDVDQGERKRGLAEKKNDLFLPSTAQDTRILDAPRASPMPSASVTPVPGGIYAHHTPHQPLAPLVINTGVPHTSAAPDSSASYYFNMTQADGTGAYTSSHTNYASSIANISDATPIDTHRPPPQATVPILPPNNRPSPIVRTINTDTPQQTVISL